MSGFCQEPTPPLPAGSLYVAYNYRFYGKEYTNLAQMYYYFILKEYPIPVPKE